MESAFPWLVIFAVAGTFAVLVIGVLAMLRGGSMNARRSNRLMRYRVIFQFSAILLIALAFLFGRG
jgi:phosphatidylglycerophosphate synthase